MRLRQTVAFLQRQEFFNFSSLDTSATAAHVICSLCESASRVVTMVQSLQNETHNQKIVGLNPSTIYCMYIYSHYILVKIITDLSEILKHSDDTCQIDMNVISLIDAFCVIQMAASQVLPTHGALQVVEGDEGFVSPCGKLLSL